MLNHLWLLTIPMFFMFRLVLKEKHYACDSFFWASIVSLLIPIVSIIVLYFK